MSVSEAPRPTSKAPASLVPCCHVSDLPQDEVAIKVYLAKFAIEVSLIAIISVLASEARVQPGSESR